MNKNERLGLLILKSELPKVGKNIQKCFDYIEKCAHLQYREEKDIALQSQQSQLQCHLDALNSSMNRMDTVIEVQCKMNQKKLFLDKKQIDAIVKK